MDHSFYFSCVLILCGFVGQAVGQCSRSSPALLICWLVHGMRLLPSFNAYLSDANKVKIFPFFFFSTGFKASRSVRSTQSTEVPVIVIRCLVHYAMVHIRASLYSV